MIKEDMIASDYQRRVEKRSLIDPNRILYEYIQLCPNCGIEWDFLEHGHTIHCRCGLTATLWGNSLECSMSEWDVIKKQLVQYLPPIEK